MTKLISKSCFDTLLALKKINLELNELFFLLMHYIERFLETNLIGKYNGYSTIVYVRGQTYLPRF